MDIFRIIDPSKSWKGASSTGAPEVLQPSDRPTLHRSSVNARESGAGSIDRPNMASHDHRHQIQAI
jgi:hypothetical protein